MSEPPLISAVSRVAAFDFDGTLARGDSLLPFLLELLGARRLASSLLRHAPAFGLLGVGKGNRDRTKGRFIAHALTGHAAEEIQATGAAFAQKLISVRVRSSMLERVKWHKSQGHRLLIISASLDVYLEPLAEQLGFDSVLCTKLEIEEGKATGRLVGANVRGREKTVRLLDFLGPEPVELWAYGNSSGDHELLAHANHPFWVNRNGTITNWVRPN